MDWYNILEVDYKNPLFEDQEKDQEKLFLQELKNVDTLKALLETDTILKALTEEQKKAFFELATCCNTLAARTNGEISIAIHPKNKEASVVIVTERLLTMNILKYYFETAVQRSFQFAAEPVEEKGPKLMLYFNHFFGDF